MVPIPKPRPRPPPVLPSSAAATAAAEDTRKPALQAAQRLVEVRGSPLRAITPGVAILARLVPRHGSDCSDWQEELLQMSSDERLIYLEEQAKSAKIMPQYIDHAQVARLYQVFKTNVKALQQYEPAAKARRITLISSEQSANAFPDSTMGWSELSTESVEVFTILGTTHYSIVRKPAVENLAQQLKACIAQAEKIELAIPQFI